MNKWIVLPLLASAVCRLGAAETRKISGIDLSFVSPQVNPCDDFYTYANGNWLKSARIPESSPLWSATEELRARNLQVIREILESSAKRSDWPRGSSRQKVGDFFASGMDEAGIEQAGIKPLAARIDLIAAVATPRDLAAALGRLHLDGINACFAPWVYLDDKNPGDYIAQFWQAGLGLPDRDYYTRVDDKSAKTRVQYRTHVARVFELLGDDPPTAAEEARTVLALETRMATASMTLVEQQDPDAVYHNFARAELATVAPGLDWEAYFSALGMPAGASQFLVRQPLFFRELGEMARGVPLADWKTYLRWRLADDSSAKLSTGFVNENFDFNGRILQGMSELSPRWMRVRDVVEQGLGFALGRIYVEQTFNARARAKAVEMVGNLRAAFADRIRQLAWMSPATKEKALEKLATLGAKIGYPDRWPDYTGLDIKRDAYVLNWMRANAFEMSRNLNKIGKPVDRGEWAVTPQWIGAFYSANLNEICFPASVLQPPFDPDAEEAVNYGGIGVIMAHEMTHGFDDQGRMYDASGVLRDWWTAEDAEAFKTRIAPLVRQYDAYRPFSDLPVNGRLTLSENISDLGGVRIAYAALQKALAGKPKSTGSDGFTPEQLFFIRYAQHWRRVYRPEYLRTLLQTDTHAPAQYLVNGPLSNMAEFRQAFACPEGCVMARPQGEIPLIW